MTTTAEPIKELTWREKSLKPAMRISASQMETFEVCPRKWWLTSVRKLKTFSTTPQILGTVLHSVCERFLSADHVGRDPKTGKAVELYPQGWEVAASKFGEPSEGIVTPAEADLIKRLVAKAIEAGVLERQPNRVIEHNFVIPVIPNVHIQGFIDLLYWDRVEDHKTTSAMKWAKSPEALKKNIQMMTYAKVCLLEAARKGEPPPPTVTLRHNVYCKDPKDARVRKTEVTVTAAEIEKFWKNTIIPMATEMAAMRERTDIWHDISEPVSLEKACNAYGGCAFRSVCHGRESEQGYELRLDRMSTLGYSLAEQPVLVSVTAPSVSTSKGSHMADFASALARKQALNKAAGGTAAMSGAAPAINPPAAPAAAPAAAGLVIKPRITLGAPAAPAAAPAPAVAAPAADRKSAPWFVKGCGACQNNPVPGFNSQGQPCRICSAKAAAAGLKTPDQYEIAPVDGQILVVGKGFDYEESFVNAAAPATIKADEKIAPVPAPTPAPVAAPAPAAAPVEPPAAEEAPKGAGGRPKKSFVLCVNAAPIKGISGTMKGRSAIYLSDTFNEVIKGLEEQKVFGDKGYWDVGAFERRDVISKNAEAIAESFGSDVLVIVTGMGPGASDMRTLYEAVRPFAGMEIHGINS